MDIKVDDKVRLTAVGVMMFKDGMLGAEITSETIGVVEEVDEYCVFVRFDGLTYPRFSDMFPFGDAEGWAVRHGNYVPA